MSYDTACEKAVDALLDSHGYTGAAITPFDGGVLVEAERTAVRWRGKVRLEAKVLDNGEVTDLVERDW